MLELRFNQQIVFVRNDEPNPHIDVVPDDNDETQITLEPTPPLPPLNPTAVEDLPDDYFE